ncbi:MAG: lytic transglycosylase domain-containing protein [Pseudolabrys sp.]|nr:lytic transglycosylase domain-containing protein [Pseudolabrys sp.]
MRQFFLPACVCLVAWPGATDLEASFTLDEFTGKVLAHAEAATTGSAPSESFDAAPSVAIAIPGRPSANPAPAQVAQGAHVAVAPALDLGIEYPVPSGVVVNNGIPAGIPLPPIAKPVIARSTEEICDTLTKSAEINNLPAPFFIRLLFQESRFDPGVISSAGAQGIAQFMPGTATDMGVENPFDPALAIPASARLLNSLVRQFGNLGLAAAAYNAGPKRIQDWLGTKGKGKLPDETQGYVKSITGHPVENWSEAAARHPGEKLPRRAPCQDSAGLLAWNGPDAVPMPQPSPLRAAPAEMPVVAATVRSDMRYADRAEREAAAAKSVANSAANKPAAIKVEAIKAEAKPTAAAKVAKSATKPAAKPTAKGATNHEKIAQR